MLSVLKLATSFQMNNIRTTAMNQLHSLPIDPIRKIAIWEEFHLDPDLLLPAYATLCQRSEPLTLSMTMTLGIRNFTKVAASRDYYRQRVGCRGCRKSLSVEESQAIAEEIVQIVFAKRASTGEKPYLLYPHQFVAGTTYGHPRLIDFDWSGREGEVQHPGNLNTDAGFPEGVDAYDFITAEHDRIMLRKYEEYFRSGE
ncbi:hypothetical protein NLJ89_g2348 [Agrocybe chaxingu]|uniref:Uncharacterized protein n=1 Tax=Agrocybe chaxingu TaxID=84603 RepID=A0A9W8K7I7_9AGAR|nr:hypothetical protein NLJ89_g2348 [Agrocybe chaxingu]